MSRKFLILIMIMVVLLAAIPMAQAKTSRGVSGSVAFPAPPEWGFEIDLWIDFDLQEVNASTHQATGDINWRMFNEELGWRQLNSHPVCVLFGEDVGEDADTVIVVTRIQQKEGWGDGLPGEYAYWWLRDNGDNDQMAILDYSYDPWYEFFPRGEHPECQYFNPGLIIEIGEGLEIIH